MVLSSPVGFSLSQILHRIVYFVLVLFFSVAMTWDHEDDLLIRSGGLSATRVVFKSFENSRSCLSFLGEGGSLIL